MAIYAPLWREVSRTRTLERSTAEAIQQIFDAYSTRSPQIWHDFSVHFQKMKTLL
jgi:hypothetical protein